MSAEASLRTRSMLGLAVVSVVFVVIPPFLPSWILFVLTIALAKAMVVLGVVLVLRGGLISLGHGLYFAGGAYAVGFTMHYLDTTEALVAVPLAIVSGAVLASLAGLILRRYRGIFFAMLSLAFSMVLYTLLLKFYAVTGGTDGLSIQPMSIAGVQPEAEHVRVVQYYLVLVLGAAVIYLGAHFGSSPLGYLMQALRYNEIRVEYMGASVNRSIYWSYVISGALGGLGGGLFAFNVGHVAPELAYWISSADFVFVAVLGGTGSVFAPFAGSIVFEFVKNYAFKLSPETWQMTLGIVLLLIIFFLPQGLWSLKDRVAGKWARPSSGPST
ncbi:MAG: branched-chain amino acid ABC transporter permease [Gammaproteobacteria bacterium]|nr:branched-chain amino acid ABC transporter permease [Gammaproteobacteria bacterium]NIR85057.1 branched-chain amino acid ABC transporter permease [Gammaproteobacteria bacterium]NIR88324.1 branched-chain amino acid ABC transporter permease [Gammaproteobacteria bacterium]NIU06104.1 branched-chain amino acid ABC transporter permease [Gammaproteobacteria bacterium]NIV73523.1 branched-chain amino acid ABC transporter permease [Gammaproteobacteria bacterium]